MFFLGLPTFERRMQGFLEACWGGGGIFSPPPNKNWLLLPKILLSKVPLFMQIMVFNRVLPPKCIRYKPQGRTDVRDFFSRGSTIAGAKRESLGQKYTNDFCHLRLCLRDSTFFAIESGAGKVHQ